MLPNQDIIKKTDFFNEYILKYILVNLNGRDLNNAAQVNRMWNKVATDIISKRGVCCTINDHLTGYPTNWDEVKTNIIDKCSVKPVLHMCYDCGGLQGTFVGQCICSFLPFDCESISIINVYVKDEENVISNIYWPKIPTITITSLIFNVHAWEYGIYCEEINFLFDFYFNNDIRLRNIYEPFLRDDSNMNNFLILFYEETKEFIASNILRTLHKWYPRRVSSIWGGMVRKLTICKNNICNYNIDCIAMLLSGTNMQTWTIVMDGKMASIEYIEIRLNELKKEITFKKHSMGLMFSGDYCDNFYLNLEPDIFMRLFPDTPLFQVLGYLALGAQDCKEADNSISDGYRRMLELSLTIVTYD